MLGGLFPDDVAIAWGDPREPSKPLFPEEEALVARAVPKRQREFAKGRECARVALASLGRTDAILLTGEHREPLWPAGVTGSITHTTDLCAVAVALSERYLGLGIDAEPAESLTPEIARRVCCGDDERVESIRSLEPALVARLVFSAKETIYKCQFPITRKFLGFEDVRVELDEETFSGALRVAAPPFREGTIVSGRWRKLEVRDAGKPHLITTAWLPRPP